MRPAWSQSKFQKTARFRQRNPVSKNKSKTQSKNGNHLVGRKNSYVTTKQHLQNKDVKKIKNFNEGMVIQCVLLEMKEFISI